MKLKDTLSRAWYGAGRMMGLGYDAGESSRFRRDLGWGRQTERDEDHLVGDRTRDMIRMRGVDLKRNNGIVSGFCSRLAKFAVGAEGISPQARTTDPGWNRAAEQYFWQTWGPSCDSRGRASLFRLQFQAMFLRPIHGGIYLQLLQNGKVRPIECERIRQPTDAKTAERYVDGVQVDPGTGEVVSYWVHSRDKNGEFGSPHAEGPIDAANILPVVTPAWRPDQVREIPDLAHVIPLIQDLAEMNQDTLATAKTHAKITAWLKKQDGQLPNMGVRGQSASTAGARETFKLDSMTVLSLFPNEDIGSFNSQIPNSIHIPYMQWQLVLCAAAMDLPYEFLTLDFSKADWSRMKGILTFINAGMRPYRRWLVDSMMRPLWCWRIAREMAPGGELSPAPKDDKGRSQWDRIEWHEPEQIWVDRQEAAQADMLEYQMGLTSLEDFAKRRGHELEPKLREIADEKLLVAKIEQEKGLPPGSLVRMQIPGQTNEPKKAENEPEKTTGDDDAEAPDGK